jgi:hypothetical protein
MTQTARRILAASAFSALLVLADLPTRQPFPGNVRLKLSIRDEDGRPTGLRLRVTNAAGEYFAPLGRLPLVDPSRRSAGDLILGDDKDTPRHLYALLYDGAEIDLPPGDYTFAASKGLEYERPRVAVKVSSQGPAAVALPLRRFENFEAKGWYPGDTHMHFPDPAGVRYEMECEGLRVCSLLLLKSGYRNGRPGDGHFWNVEHFTGQLSPLSDSRHFIKVGEEFRHGLLAHLIFQNLKSIVWPVSTGGLRESGAGGFDWPLMLHAADDARSQGALVSWAHWPYPSLEAPLDIALGRIDSLDLLTTGSPFEHHPILVGIYKMHGPSVYSLPPLEVYYHYLNCGFRLAASAGSDKMALNPPLGSARTYVKTDGPLSYDSWIEGIRRGRTFITTYPLLEFSVNGKEAGETLKLEPGAARLAIRARAVSLEPYDLLEILYNGRIVRTARPTGDRFEATLAFDLDVDRGGWLAARAHGSKMLPYGETWWQQPVFAHTSPVYLDMPGRPVPAAGSAKLFLEQLGYFEEWVNTKAYFPTPANRDEALRLFAQARAVYRKVLGAGGR